MRSMVHYIPIATSVLAFLIARCSSGDTASVAVPTFSGGAGGS